MINCEEFNYSRKKLDNIRNKKDKAIYCFLIKFDEKSVVTNLKTEFIHQTLFNIVNRERSRSNLFNKMR